jgi:hypothetical protein
MRAKRSELIRFVSTISASILAKRASISGFWATKAAWFWTRTACA